MDANAAALEAAILSLLDAAPAASTIRPRDAAQAVAAANADGTDPSALDGPARSAARRLAAAGEVVIVVGSQVVDPSTAGGDIAIRRARP